MSIKGEIIFNENPVIFPIRAMQTQAELIGISNENINGFDKVGYQAKRPVVSSFAEYIGAKAVSTTLDDTVGRLGLTKYPLDLALAEKGYFQIQTPSGIILTRDGRLKLSKEGDLLNLEGYPILSNNGEKITLPIIPESIEDIKIDLDGRVSVLNRETKKLEYAGTISTVTQNGVGIMHPKVSQGYLEYSNVDLTTEFIQSTPYMKNFTINRQMYSMVNSTIQKAISSLGQV